MRAAAVPTLRFQILYVFLVLAHDRRRILHFGVTAHPTAEWTAQQLREAFPWDGAPRYLLRDRDRIFGDDFIAQVKAMGIQQVLAACLATCIRSFGITMAAARIWGCERTLPILGRSRSRKSAESFPFPKSAACIIATNVAPPESARGA